MTVSTTVEVLILSDDFFYFSEVTRHMLEELIAALEDKEFGIRYSLRHYIGGLWF